MRVGVCAVLLGAAVAVRFQRRREEAAAKRTISDAMRGNMTRQCPARVENSNPAFVLGSAGFNGPQCETQLFEIKFLIDDLVGGALALLNKRSEIQTYNRPTIPGWNTSALTAAELQEDLNAVDRGFRPPGGSNSYPGKMWMGSKCQKLTAAAPGGTATANAPDPATVSQNLMHPNGQPRLCSDSINQWFVAWIQLNVEDWVRGERLGVKGRHGPNVATHWWDMDSTYGTGMDEVFSTRTFVDGKVNPDGIASREDIGQWVGISALKYALASEHNYIAEQLATRYPSMAGDDETLFGTARLITVGLVARIHTIHWTQVLLNAIGSVFGQQTLWNGLTQALLGYAPDSGTAATLQSIFSLFTDNNTIAGIPGGILQQDYEFAWPEEFSLVYRLHPMLPDSMQIAGRTVSLLQMAAHANQYGYENVAKGMSETPACALTLQNYPEAFGYMILQTGDAAFDLGEHDVIATRARGIGSINDLRRALHLNPATSFTDLVCDGRVPDSRQQRLIDALSRVYATIEDVDAVVGIMAEPRVVEGLLGLSQYLVFVAFTQSRLDSDPFFTEKFNSDYYTSWGLEHIETRTIGGILTDHLGQTFSSDHVYAGFMMPGWQIGEMNG